MSPIHVDGAVVIADGQNVIGKPENATEYKWMGSFGLLLDIIFPKMVQISFQYESMPTFIKVSAVVLIGDSPNGFMVEVGMDPLELSLSMLDSS